MQEKIIPKKSLLVNLKMLDQWHFLPMVVSILGMLSFALLLWLFQISQKQSMNFELCDAIMDIQVKVATSHLWLEEAITGDEEVDIQEVKDELDVAITLADALLNGGKSEHDVILQPLKDVNLRKAAEEIKSLLIEFRTIALQRLQNPEAAGIGSVLDQKFDAAFKEFSEKARALEVTTEKNQIRAQTRTNRLFWGILLVWVIIGIGASGGIWNREVKRRVAQTMLEKAHDQLQYQTRELERYKEGLEDLVEKRTMDLVTTNLQLEKEVDERRATEKLLRASESQLRHLSSTLFNAQEVERKRISKELHDELGGTLASLKINFSMIERDLRKDQDKLKNTCVQSIEALGLLIDNVSRLSRNLSPYLLEELGLSAALQRMINAFSQRFNVGANLEISDIDGLFPGDAQIIIYRIIQESLTNVSKHSEARNVSVMVEQRSGVIRFVVEDDGKGFDIKKVSARDVYERGMGLTIVDERVRMLGGSLDLWSQEGKGSRIKFEIPVNKNWNNGMMED